MFPSNRSVFKRNGNALILLALAFFIIFLGGCKNKSGKASRIIIRNSSLKTSEFFLQFFKDMAAYNNEELLFDSMAAEFASSDFIYGMDDNEKQQVRAAFEILSTYKYPLLDPPSIHLKLDGRTIINNLNIPALGDDTISVIPGIGSKHFQLSGNVEGLAFDTTMNIDAEDILIEYFHTISLSSDADVPWNDYMMPALKGYPLRVINGLAAYFQEYAYRLNRSGIQGREFLAPTLRLSLNGKQ